MAEASIGSAVEKLEADTQRVRSDGLEDLKRVLGAGRNASTVDSLGDDGFHKIFELLYRLIRIEKPAYLKALKQITKNTTAARLGDAAAAFRLTVEVGAPVIRFKTAVSVLDHIVGTLPNQSQGLCEPLKLDYLKSFRAVLEQPSHAEHLRPKQWQNYVDFALEHIGSFVLDGEGEGEEDGDGDGVIPLSREASMSSRAGQRLSVRASQRSNRSSRLESANHVDELLQALKSLSAVTHMPLMTRADAIAETLTNHLKSANRAHETVFEILNNVILAALNENLVLVHKTLMALLPSIRRLWSTKLTALRDQMLIMLTACQPLFLTKGNVFPSVAPDLSEQLLHLLLAEYSSRTERDVLDLDDIEFVFRETTPSMPRLLHLQPVPNSIRAMSTWLQLSLMANLALALSQQATSVEADHNGDAEWRKRRRTETAIDDILYRIEHSSGVRRLSSMQLLLFAFDQSLPLPGLALTRIPDLLGTLLDGDPRIASFAMLLFARYASIRSHDAQLEDIRQTLWTTARRAITSTYTVRAACHLLDVLIATGTPNTQLAFTSFEDSLFGGGTNGPCLVTDTAIHMFTHALWSASLAHDAAFESFALRVVAWLGARWTLPSVLDRNHNSQLASQVQAQYLCSLFSTAVGSHHKWVKRSTPATANLFSRPTAMLLNLQPFLNLLLDINDKCDCANINRRTLEQRAHDPAVSTRISQAINELCRTKLTDFRSSWADLSLERGSNINNDVVEIMTTALVTGLAFSTDTADIASEDNSTLTTCCQKAWSTLYLHVSQQTVGDMKLSAATICQTLHSLRSDAPDHDRQFTQSRQASTKSLSSIVKRLVSKTEDEDAMDMDFMDSLPSRNSQTSHSNSVGPRIPFLRVDLQTPMVQTEIGLLAWHFVELLVNDARARGGPNLDSEICSVLIDEIVSLPPELLLSASGAVIDFLHIEPAMARADAARLLERLAVVCLQSDELERCESALCFCLSAMTLLVEMWAIEEEDDLAAVGFDMCSWYLNIALEKGIASPRVLLGIADLLEAIMRTNLAYGSTELPSARTSLLKVLSIGGPAVKSHLSSKLKRLFDRYVLTEHAVIFDDILETLPTDPDNREGIAVRLMILAELGAEWHTVLRQATYHLFETAANVPPMGQHAMKCIEKLSSCLHLPSSQELLRLFAPQLLYTWLGQHDIRSIPFAAFQYESLSALVSSNTGEFVAQVALRGSSSHAEDISKILGLSWTQLLAHHFPKAEAYCLASDTSVPKTEQLFSGAEPTIRKQLGNETYFQCILDRMPDIVAALFITLQDDRGIDKALEKAGQKVELSAFREMSRLSSSDSMAPPGQQPTFRAKCLIDELAFLYLRVDITKEAVWTPSMLTHVYRSLLTDAAPTFGPVHLGTVVRKIRVAVCLGVSVATSGYPLEMLLHNLRPHLTSFHTSEDSIGVFRYLLQTGKAYLQTRLSFIVGLSVSVFASLTDFVASSQDSTTQESHFRSTMSKAHEFRAWLGTYLTGLESTNATEANLATFKSILASVISIEKSKEESRLPDVSKLVLNILLDKASDQPLLTAVHFDMSLETLCKSLGTTLALDVHHATEASSQDCLRIAPVLQHGLRHLQLNDHFGRWAAQIIGQAYGSSGLSMYQTNSDVYRSKLTMDYQATVTEASSYTKIVTSIADLLWRSDMKMAGFAERILQTVSTSLTTTSQRSLLDSSIDHPLLDDLRYQLFPCPKLELIRDSSQAAMALERLYADANHHTWLQDLVITLSSGRSEDPVLGPLGTLAAAVPSVCSTVLPYVVHLVLLSEIDSNRTYREKLSHVFSAAISNRENPKHDVCRQVIDTVLYLRRCRLPSESTMAQRHSWLEVDYSELAEAAACCGLWHEGLLFMEIHQSQMNLQSTRSSRRSFVTGAEISAELITNVFRNVEDPDFFYGSPHDVDMTSIVAKLSHERAGFKTLSFQSAIYDAALRIEPHGNDIVGVSTMTVAALEEANFTGISQAIAKMSDGMSGLSVNDRSNGQANAKQWRLSQQQTETNASHLLSEALGMLGRTSDRASITTFFDRSLLQVFDILTVQARNVRHQGTALSTLAALCEVRKVLQTTDFEEARELVEQTGASTRWAKHDDFESILPQLAARETLFHSLNRNEPLRSALALSRPQSILLEVQALRQSLKVAQEHEMAQFCLTRAMFLSDLCTVADSVGISVSAAVNHDLADTLWAQNETEASIKILRELHSRGDLTSQSIAISQSAVLTDLGQKVAEARLEKPDEIIAKYLLPAFKHLRGKMTGIEAGRSFHVFATFCDDQLQDPDNLDDFTRVCNIRERKFQEIRDLETMIKGSEGKTRDQLKVHHFKAKTWFKLDDEEWKRLQANRETLILQCLENYLLTMIACDDYPNGTLRFLALWLNQAESPTANAAVHKYLSSVPTWKFAPLMNQLSSRLLDSKDDFQQILYDLMFRICCDHPYHSLYQVFAASKSKGSKGDEIAYSRYNAANKLAKLVREKGSSGHIWVAVHNSSIAFVRMAQERLADKDVKTGSKILLRKLAVGQKLESTIQEAHTKIPPPTLNIPLRADRNYSKVPTLDKFEPQISIAGGVSAPKITTAIASDGNRFKMLLKGGNDDLRQDSIMEQVFELVSNLLKEHRATRQRQLGIRTYKVIPLYPNAGIIEFVKDTIPLHDYLLPAHTRYFPKDYKPNRCRKEIADAQTKPLQQRIQAFRNVVANFHPVMRFFFMENFLNPDDWFRKRLSYSRSSAAISILGHVLGLGDRHGHNILLDQNSGEVVHIDLGVAFEAGRVLPVPEVVPFRLTRDLVDGMGMSGVEGPFRRCCNFTLEALRREQEAIMTILDVLRYDPLVAWTVSPLRLQKMQENNEQAGADEGAGDGINDGNANGGMGAGGVGRRDPGEPNEADRALTVVAKKLGKSLSVEATVNELIRQATDERNLAVLYCGWAAYA